jgi:uncharacterized membrane protein YoaK (UPF0700 family)
MCVLETTSSHQNSSIRSHRIGHRTLYYLPDSRLFLGDKAVRRRRLPRPSSDDVRLGLMLALTFSTGVADAVGYLGLDKVFTGNMTGNIVILGMAVAGAKGLPVLGPAVALLGFMFGAAVAGRALRGRGSAWTGVTTCILVAAGCLLALATILLALPLGLEPSSVHLVAAGILATTMGAQAAAARQLAVKDVTTVVVTSTITGLAADSWLGARVSQPWIRRILAIVLISSGAAVGALLLPFGISYGVVLSAGITLACAWLGHAFGRTRTMSPSPVIERVQAMS